MNSNKEILEFIRWYKKWPLHPTRPLEDNLEYYGALFLPRKKWKKILPIEKVKKLLLLM